jgi:hypothetical protein
MPSTQFLSRRIGQQIDSGHVAVFRDRDGVGSVNSLWLRFKEGKSLVLGCAGDGGIFSRKAEPQTGRVHDLGHLEQDPIPFLAGATLEAVEPAPDRLCLRTSRGVVTLHNRGDELVVEFSGVVPGVA